MAPLLARSLSRLSRDSLTRLCLEWSQSTSSTPYLASNRNLLESDEEDYLHEPAVNTQELRSLYEDLRKNATGKEALSKRDIIDRIVDGDWRRGLSLHQLATIDFAYLEQNDAALRWSALKLVPSKSKEDESIHLAKRRKLLQTRTDHPLYPETTPATFIANLKAQISPLVKAHYSLHRLSSIPNLAILRLYIVPNTAFAPSKSSIPKSPREATDSARVMYIALPDSCPYVYVSISGSTGSKPHSDPKASTRTKVDIASTKRIVLEAIPKALSRSQERWALESTKLTTKNLKSICLLRGNDRPGTGGGAYSKFSEEYPINIITDTIEPLHSHSEHSTKPTHQAAHLPPLQVQLPTPPPEDLPTHDLQVNNRFGSMSGPSHASLNRFTVKLTNILTPPAHIIQCQSQHQPKPRPKPRKRKRLSLEEIEKGSSSQAGSQDLDHNHDHDHEREQAEPRTITLSSSSLSITTTSEQIPASILITFSGSDVFAGLKELALLGDEYVDLKTMPSWITGERGVSALTV